VLVARIAAVALCAAGCGGDGLPVADLGPDQATPVDLALPPDLAVRSPIGGPCKMSSDCGEGKGPVCWARNLYNKAGYLPTMGGYCSAKCIDDLDCGVSGICVDHGSNGRWCMASCGGAEDCRTGYGCFDWSPAPYCWPNTDLQCDPTVPDGLCTTYDGKPGGCWRAAFGAGKTGYCYELCAPGAGSCLADNGGTRQCVVFDLTRYKDAAGNLTGDKFHGPICIYSYATNDTGQECKYIDAGGGTHHYLDACIDGDECYSTYFQGGDNKCRVMCDPRLALPDGGDADAGVAGLCPAGTVCKDIFQLFGSKWPVGLCF
jgi:hypothetical protein